MIKDTYGLGQGFSKVIQWQGRAWHGMRTGDYAQAFKDISSYGQVEFSVSK